MSRPQRTPSAADLLGTVRSGLLLRGNDVHKLRDGTGYRVYRLKDGKTVALYATIEGVAECCGWLERRPLPPIAVPSAADQHPAQRLRRLLLPKGLGTRRLFPRGWVVYRLNRPLEVVARFRRLEDMEGSL